MSVAKSTDEILLPQSLREQMLLDTDAVAALVGLSRQWFVKARISGIGPRYLKIGRRIVYRHADVLAWLEKHERSSTSG